MAGESKQKQYITCSKCKCKYINDEEHIKNDFGYTRLEERYKTCVKCRDMVKKHYKDNQENIKNSIKTIKNIYYKYKKLQK